MSDRGPHVSFLYENVKVLPYGTAVTWAGDVTRAGGGRGRTAEVALEQLRARRPGSAWIRARRWRGAGRAARWTFWSPESPAVSKSAVADGERGVDDSSARAASRDAILGDDGEDVAAERPACLDSSGEERSGGGVRRRRRRARDHA